MVSQLLSFLRMTFAPKYAQTCYAPTCTARKKERQAKDNKIPRTEGCSREAV